MMHVRVIPLSIFLLKWTCSSDLTSRFEEVTFANMASNFHQRLPRAQMSYIQNG